MKHLYHSHTLYPLSSFPLGQDRGWGPPEMVLPQRRTWRVFVSYLVVQPNWEGRVLVNTIRYTWIPPPGLVPMGSIMTSFSYWFALLLLCLRKYNDRSYNFLLLEVMNWIPWYINWIIEPFESFCIDPLCMNIFFIYIYFYS